MISSYELTFRKAVFYECVLDSTHNFAFWGLFHKENPDFINDIIVYNCTWRR